MRKLKNVSIVVNEFANCYEYAVEISAYTKAEQNAPAKNWLAIACCPKIESKTYSLDSLDEIEEEELEYVKEELIDSYIQDYCEEMNIDIETAKIHY